MTVQGHVTSYGTRAAMSLRGIVTILRSAHTATLRGLIQRWERSAHGAASRLQAEEACLAAERRAMARSKRRADQCTALIAFRGTLVALRASAIQSRFARWVAAWRAHCSAVQMRRHQACLRWASVNRAASLVRRVIASMRMHAAVDLEAHGARVMAGKVSGLEKVVALLRHVEQAGIVTLLALWRMRWLQELAVQASDEAAREEIRAALAEAEVEHNASILRWDKLRSADFDARHMASVIRVTRECALRDLRRVLGDMRSSTLRNCVRRFSINRHRYGMGAREAVQECAKSTTSSQATSPLAQRNEQGSPGPRTPGLFPKGVNRWG